MSGRIAFIVMCSLAVLGIVEVALFRFGYLQKWPRRYFEAGAAPNSVRYGIFGLLPWSLAILSLALMLAAAQLPWAAGYFVLLLLALALALFGFGFWWISHPPEFLKPEWMRAQEAAIQSGEREPPSPDSPIEVSPGYYALSWVGLGIVFVLGFVFLGPWPTLIGLGIGLPYLLAMRPRRPARRR